MSGRGLYHYDVAAAADGLEALDLAARERPDVILMDLIMPGMDGAETSRMLKAHSPMVGVRTLVASLVVLASAACCLPIQTLAPDKEPLSGAACDPAFDWEKATVPPGLDRNWARQLTFQSARTLEQTTRWIAWALERHGHVVKPAWESDLSDVRVESCTMTWMERRVSAGVTTESVFRVPLGDLDLELRAPSGSSGEVRFSLVEPVKVPRTYYENGRSKGGGEDSESSILINLVDKDAIGERVSWAVTYAARQCGAEVRTE